MIRTPARQLAALVGLAAFTFTAQAQNISLMSYNIGSSNWIGNRDSVVARIVFNNPDIFCAIEATGNSRPFLESSLTDYYMLQTFGATPNLTESHIFYRKNMFVVLDSGFVEMETYGGYTGPGRYVNWARLEETTSQSQFLVYASHILFVFPGNPDSATIGQYRHADAMVQLMNQHASLQIPMITVGDFNADSTKAVMQFLLHQTPITYNSTTITNPIELDDSWYIANPAVQKPATVSSGSASIDWILSTPNANVTSAIIDDQGENSSGDFPSDHRPLMITFDLTSTSIGEPSSELGLQAFPNPFQDHIQLAFSSSLDEPISFQLFDVTGKPVRDIAVAGGGPIRIDLGDLADGLYFYRLQTSDQRDTGTILKRNF